MPHCSRGVLFDDVRLNRNSDVVRLAGCVGCDVVVLVVGINFAVGR